MKWIVRVLLGGMVFIGVAGCAAAPPAPAVATARRGGEASAAPACPPGTISDGARCRRQRGIVIDQRQMPSRDQGGEDRGNPSAPCPGGAAIDGRCTPSPPPPPEPRPLSWLDLVMSLLGDG
jgi:hypothetical protein